jgi:magnesium transporter
VPDTPPPQATLDEAYVERVRTLLAEGRRGPLARALAALHPSDVADLFEAFDTDDRVTLFSLLARGAAADVLVELDRESREDLIDRIRPDDLREALAELEPDEAADVIGEMEPHEAAQALAGLEDRSEIEQLLEYPPETAGGLMTTEFVTLPASATVREAVKRTRGASETTHRHVLFVTDEAGRLVGQVPLFKLVVSPADTRVADIMDDEVHAVPADLDREDVADVVRRYDLVAVPVIDPATDRVKGIITFDDVMDAADEEAAEDMYRMAGTAATDPLHQPVLNRALLRLPWLLITLLPGFLVGQIMRWLGYDPGGTTALLLFVPVMIEMAGNVSLQSSTVMVRGIAIGDLRSYRFMNLLGREVAVALLVGVVCGLVSGAVAYVFFGHDTGFAVVVAFSMLCGILSAAVTGTVIPLGCERMGVDPALASGPFVTSMNDIMGTLIYLGLGARLLVFFGH